MIAALDFRNMFSLISSHCDVLMC